jgi:hypothetical protein
VGQAAHCLGSTFSPLFRIGILSLEMHADDLNMVVTNLAAGFRGAGPEFVLGMFPQVSAAIVAEGISEEVVLRFFHWPRLFIALPAILACCYLSHVTRSLHSSVTHLSLNLFASASSIRKAFRMTWKLLAIRAGYIRLGLISKY